MRGAVRIRYPWEPRQGARQVVALWGGVDKACVVEVLLSCCATCIRVCGVLTEEVPELPTRWQLTRHMRGADGWPAMRDAMHLRPTTKCMHCCTMGQLPSSCTKGDGSQEYPLDVLPLCALQGPVRAPPRRPCGSGGGSALPQG